jgi:hypothetical protein
MAFARRVPLLLALLVALAVPAAIPGRAEACTCLPADLATIYNRSDAVLRVRVLGERTRGEGLSAARVYTVRVRAVYKGCHEPQRRTRLVTSVQSGLCGVTLEVGGDYLVTGRSRGPNGALDIGSCGRNVPFASLTPDELAFLDTRFVCCGDDCACVNGDPVQCFVDPCEVASCPDGTCTANYCGGCHAEFADAEGNAVCQPCRSDDDCPASGQRCAENGRCARGCGSSGDCGADSWCAPTDDGGSECRPFQRAGGVCEAYTPPSGLQICAPNFSCEPRDPRIPDLGGHCRRSCEDSSDCPERKYCSPSMASSLGADATDRVCRRDGTCLTAADCRDPDNGFVAPLCIGYATCEAGTCGWICGVPCDDLAGADFGPCDALLGFAPVNGSCAPISGCDAGGVPLHPSQAACEQACGD